jgi:hypothetical protein
LLRRLAARRGDNNMMVPLVDQPATIRTHAAVFSRTGRSNNIISRFMDFS